MDTKEYIKSLQIGNDTLFLILKNQYPLVEYSDETFLHLSFLVEKIPSLSNQNIYVLSLRSPISFGKDCNSNASPRLKLFKGNIKNKLNLKKYIQQMFFLID